MTALHILAICALVVYLTFVHYSAVMNLQRVRDAGKLTVIQRPFAYIALGIGLVLDFLLNVAVCTLLFVELPREWLVTARLIRHKRAGQGWRFRLASWLCTNLLDNLDPKGCHCRTD